MRGWCCHINLDVAQDDDQTWDEEDKAWDIEIFNECEWPRDQGRVVRVAFLGDVAQRPRNGRPL